jgi:hypothetical protein
VSPRGAAVAWTGGGVTLRCRGRGGRLPDARAVRDAHGLSVVRLGGLAPGTGHRCRLGGRRLRFRTAPPDARPFTFVALGDSGDGSREAAALAARVAAVPAAFLVHLGDLAYPRGTAAELDARFFRPFAAALTRLPLFPTPGNHDATRDSAYRAAFATPLEADRHYAFDWGPAHLVSLATWALEDDADGAARWLADDLARAAGRPWRIVFLHEPLYGAGVKSTVPGLRERLGPILEAGRVDLVLAGHEHVYARTEPVCTHVPGTGVLHVTSGGGGADLGPGLSHPFFARTAAVVHYLRVRVGPRTLRLRAVALDGTLVDEVTLRRGAPRPCRRDGGPPPRAR